MEWSENSSARASVVDKLSISRVIGPCQTGLGSGFDFQLPNYQLSQLPKSSTGGTPSLPRLAHTSRYRLHNNLVHHTSKNTVSFSPQRWIVKVHSPGPACCASKVWRRALGASARIGSPARAGSPAK